MKKKDETIYNKTKKYLESKNEENIDEKMANIEYILNISDYKERISYLYDLICEYLDNIFKDKCICDFKNGICIGIRNNTKIKDKETFINGCCHSNLKHFDCANLDKDGKCKTKNIGCKLFTCSYLKNKGYIYKLNDIYLARYLFNIRQKYYIENTFYITKEEIIDGIIKRK